MFSEELDNLVSRYMRNKQGMKFSEEIITEGKNISVHIKGVDDLRYRKALDKLTRSVCKCATQYLESIFDADYALENDFLREKEKNKRFLANNISYYLTTLLSKGTDAFYEVTEKHKSFLSDRYELDFVTFKDGVCITQNGTVVKGNRAITAGWERHVQGAKETFLSFVS